MCYHMHFLTNSSDDDFQLSNGPYASRYRIDCRREDVFFCAKNPSRDMISIGWRRYLMSECWLSNHNAVIIATERAYACTSSALRIATCMLGRVAAGDHCLVAKSQVARCCH